MYAFTLLFIFYLIKTENSIDLSVKKKQTFIFTPVMIILYLDFQ